MFQQGILNISAEGEINTAGIFSQILKTNPTEQEVIDKFKKINLVQEFGFTKIYNLDIQGKPGLQFNINSTDNFFVLGNSGKFKYEDPNLQIFYLGLVVPTTYERKGKLELQAKAEGIQQMDEAILNKINNSRATLLTEAPSEINFTPSLNSDIQTNFASLSSYLSKEWTLYTDYEAIQNYLTNHDHFSLKIEEDFLKEYQRGFIKYSSGVNGIFDEGNPQNSIRGWGEIIITMQGE